MAIAFVISLVMGIVGYGVYVWWGYNNFTAAVFMAACYNLMWGVFHYSLDKALTPRALLEILVISLIIIGMILEVTNFKARILDGCQYYLSF